MAKFKKTKFDYRYVALFPHGRYLLVAGTYKEQKNTMRIGANVAKDAGLGDPYLMLTVDDSAFRYMAKEIQPKVDNISLDYDSIVLYNGGEYLDG